MIADHLPLKPRAVPPKGQAVIDLADGLPATGVCPGNREMLIHTPE